MFGLVLKLLTIPFNKMGPILEAGDDTRNTILKVAKLLNITDSISKILPSPVKNTLQPPRVLLLEIDSVLPQINKRLVVQ